MKKILGIAILILSTGSIFGQTLYDLSWEFDGVEYNGLMVFYNEDDIVMRVGFEEEEGYHVKETEYVFEQDEVHNEYIFLEATASDFIQDEGGWVDEEFHFFWIMDENRDMEGPFAITDYGLEHELFEEVIEVTLRDLSPEEINVEYISQFYFDDEVEYELLLASSNQPEFEPAQKETSKLHFIVAANTDIPDIGASTLVDMKKLGGELKGIADVLKMEFVQSEISGKNFTKSNLLSKLKQVEVGANDVIFFYYSGHGFRYADQKEQYPELDLRFNEYKTLGPENSINLVEVKQQIEAKGARLNLFFGDCCNSDVGVNKWVGTNFLASRSNVNPDVQKLEKLFLQSEGSILAAGANVGEYSWCSSDGGFFTMSFINALREETSALRRDDNADWQDIMLKSKKGTKKKTDLCATCKDQNVIFVNKVK